MENQLKTTQDNEQLESIINSKSITGSGKITARSSIMDLEFKAQNRYTVGKTTIKAVDMSVAEAHFTGDRTPDELIAGRIKQDGSPQLLLGNDDNSSQLVLISEKTLSFLNNEDPIDTLENVFKDSAKLEILKKEYQNALEMSKNSIISSTSEGKNTIENGLIKIHSLTYKNFADDRQFKSFEQVQKQIELDNSLNIEHAQAINNELYEKFPILNNSTPIVTMLNNKIVSQLDILLSRTYSSDPIAANKVIKEVLANSGKHGSVFNDLFAGIILGIAKGADYPVAPFLTHINLEKDLLGIWQDILLGRVIGSTIVIERNEPLRIIHSTDRTNLDNLGKTEAAGFYSPEYNVALFLDTAERAVHEFVHAFNNLVFNNKGNPFSLKNENFYLEAVKDFLLNLNAKLKQSNDSILEFELSSMRYNLESFGILELLAMAKTPSLDIKKFFTSKDIFLDEDELREWELNEWLNKHFKDSIIEEISHEQITAKLAQEIEKIGLTPIEFEVISRLSHIFYSLEKSSFDAKLTEAMINSYSEHEDKSTVKDIFSLDFIHNLNVKLGHDHKKLLELEISEIYNNLKTSSPLDLFAMSITPSLDIKDFFREKFFFSNETYINEFNLEAWKNKYFKDSVIEDITNEQIIAKLSEEVIKIGLSPMEAEVISRISSLFYHYTKDLLGIELPSKMLELYHEFGEEAVVKEMFTSIDKYWVDYVHPVMEQDLIIPHQLECNGTTNTNIFVHCVEEFMA